MLDLLGSCCRSLDNTRFIGCLGIIWSTDTPDALSRPEAGLDAPYGIPSSCRSFDVAILECRLLVDRLAYPCEAEAGRGDYLRPLACWRTQFGSGCLEAGFLEFDLLMK
ncbi:hypothetical protein NL676_031520 [Syzygium grande]|nr:hypothetical protein NL676_031520 [Syzygium grande]